MSCSRGTEESSTPPRVGDQLELDLAGPGRAWIEPWGGVSPRLLTKMAKMIRVDPLPAPGLRELFAACMADSTQLDLFELRFL